MTSQVLSIEENSQAGAARRAARDLAARLGFLPEMAERVSLVVTELATNLLKHSGGGELLLSHSLKQESPELEILSLDRGSGIRDVGESLRDGYSSTGTAGTGLGAVFRLSDEADIFTMPGEGTAIYCRFGPPGWRAAEGELAYGAVQTAKPGEEVCGDAWAIHQQCGLTAVMVADGLGHGPGAADASQQAIAAFECDPLEPIPLMLHRTHSLLRSTRGAAVSVACVDHERRIIQYGGVGNVTGLVYTPGEPLRHMVSINGTAGHELRRAQEFVYPFTPGSLLVMYSDGLATQIRIDQYRGLAARVPTLVAGVLYRDFGRRRDDSTVVVVRLME